MFKTLNRLSSNYCTILANKSRYFKTTVSAAVSAHSERKIKVSDVSISYVQVGAGDRAVLLLPGALGSAWTDFRPQIENLPKQLPDHTIIAWDPPGYGKSIPPQRQFTVDFFERDADAANGLMSALGFRKYTALGWSDGGITGMLLAATYPEIVERLVIWGSNAYVLPEELELYESIRDVKQWSPKMRAPMEKLYGAEGFARMWSDWVDVYGRILKEKNGDICSDELSKIVAPTLILHGAKDPMIAAEHIPFLRKHIKNTEYYEFKDGKHNVHLRFPDEFNKIVADFLKK